MSARARSPGRALVRSDASSGPDASSKERPDASSKEKPDASSEKDKELTVLLAFPTSMFFAQFRGYAQEYTTYIPFCIWSVCFVLMLIVTFLNMAFQWYNDTSVWTIPAHIYALNRHCLFLWMTLCAVRRGTIHLETIQANLGTEKLNPSQVIELVKTTPVGWVLAIFVGHCMSEQAMLPFELTPLYTLESNFIMHAIFHFCFISVMCRFSDDDRKGFWYVMETILIHIVLDTWGLPSSLGNKVTWTVMTVLCKHFVEEVLLNAITQPDNKTPGIVDVWHKTLHDNAQLLRNAVSRQYEIKLLAFLRSDNREETKKRTIEKKMIVDLLDTVMEQALLENGCENLHNATKQDECLRKLLQTCSCNSTFHGVFFIIVDSILVGVYAWCQYFDWTWAHSVNLALLRLMAVLWYASVEYGPIYKVLLEIARAKSIRNQLSAMMVRATTSRSAVFALLSEQNLNPIPDRRRVTLLHTDPRGDKCIVQCGEDLLDEDAINGKLYCRKCWAARMRMPVKNHAVLIGWGKEVIPLVSPPSDEEKQILCGQCNEVCDRNRGGRVLIVQSEELESENIVSSVNSESEEKGFNTSVLVPVTLEEVVTYLVALGVPSHYFQEWFKKNSEL